MEKKQSSSKSAKARSTPEKPAGSAMAGPPVRHGVASIGDILKRWLRENKGTKRIDQGQIFARWSQIVGDPVASRTRVVDLNSGELTVEVNSAALLTELSTYYRKDILESLHQSEEFRGIQKIRFRAGAF